LKLVNTEIMHLTLRFLGEIPQPTVEEVKKAIDAVRFSAFEIELSGLGAFPNLRRLNVVWVGIKRGHEQMAEIFQQLEPKLRTIGLPADNKGFSPHLTIARVRTGANMEALANYVSTMGEQEFGKMLVQSVRLKRSTLTPRGPIYSTMHEIRSTTT